MFEGIDVAALADRVSTPFFLFSPRQVRWNVETLRNAFSPAPPGHGAFLRQQGV